MQNVRTNHHTISTLLRMVILFQAGTAHTTSAPILYTHQGIAELPLGDTECLVTCNTIGERKCRIRCARTDIVQDLLDVLRKGSMDQTDLTEWKLSIDTRILAPTERIAELLPDNQSELVVTGVKTKKLATWYQELRNLLEDLIGGLEPIAVKPLEKLISSKPIRIEPSEARRMMLQFMKKIQEIDKTPILPHCELILENNRPWYGLRFEVEQYWFEVAFSKIDGSTQSISCGENNITDKNSRETVLILGAESVTLYQVDVYITYKEHGITVPGKTSLPSLSWLLEMERGLFRGVSGGMNAHLAPNPGGIERYVNPILRNRDNGAVQQHRHCWRCLRNCMVL